MDFDFTVEQLKNGFIYEDEHYTCIFCHQTYSEDEVYAVEERFLTAKGMIKYHIKEQHQSPFHALIKLDKKDSGLSEVQREMIEHFYNGTSDAEIAKVSSVNSVSTVRQHRFKLREKEKQANVLIAIMELLQKPNPYEIHKGAKQVDERYSAEEKERNQVLTTYFKNGLDGGIDIIPSKEKKKLIILTHILKRFEVGKHYHEKEVNEILKTVHADFVSLRRHLIEYGFMDRSKDGTEYWVRN